MHMPPLAPSDSQSSQATISLNLRKVSPELCCSSSPLSSTNSIRLLLPIASSTPESLPDVTSALSPNLFSTDKETGDLVLQFNGSLSSANTSTPPSNCPRGSARFSGISSESELHLRHLIGRGTVCTVWHASLGSPINHEGCLRVHERDVAVKLACHPVEMQSLLHEFKVYSRLRQLQGRDIPECYGCFRSGDVCALLMEQVGTPLDNFNDPVDRRQVLSALRLIHDAGVLHRDLRPENIVKSELGAKHGLRSLRIIDFSHADLEHVCAGMDRCLELAMFKDLSYD